MCLYAVSPFSDRIYGTVSVRYGPKPYNTVKMKLRYGSGMVREYGRPYFGLFAGKKEVLGSNPGLNRTFCFFFPFLFVRLLLNKAAQFHIIYIFYRTFALMEK